MTVTRPVFRYDIFDHRSTSRSTSALLVIVETGWSHADNTSRQRLESSSFFSIGW